MGTTDVRHISTPLGAGAARAGIPRILLLPPKPEGGGLEPQQLSLARSLLRDITLTLCKSRHFEIIAPYTARQMVDGPADGRLVELKLDYRVTTRLVPSEFDGGYSRLLLSLFAAGDSEPLYTDEIELGSGPLLDLHFALYSLVAERISGAVARQELLQFRRTGAASAYVHYLIAMEYSDRIDLASVLRSQKSLTRSVQLSPDYVPALTQLARTMTIEWLQRGIQDRRLLIEAQRLAWRAQSYDPTDSGSLREIGHAALYLHDLDTALESYEMAAHSAPNHADLLADQADALAHASRPEEAETRIARAFELNPLAPDGYYWIGGAVSFFRGRYEEGLTRLTTMRSPGPAVRLMAACAAMAGDLEAAKAYRDRTLERDPTFRVEDWTSLYPQRDPRDAKHYLDALRLAGFH